MTDKEITKLLDLIATQHTRIAALEKEIKELEKLLAQALKEHVR